MKDIETYTTEKRVHIDRIQHLDKIGDMEGLDAAMRKYRDFLADWAKRGIHKIPLDKQVNL